MLEFCDSHAHLDSAEFDADREEMISRAKRAGVTRLIAVGPSDGNESSKRAIALAKSHEGIWATVGIHPHDVARPFSYDELRELAKEEKVVAFGEIGLDFYRDWSPFYLQEEHFRRQVELAIELKKPVIIHSREAGEKCLAILKEHGAQEVGGVFHCYSEDAAFAKKIAEMNFLVSFPGSLTFKNAHSTREAAKAIPLDQILIETDAPFLSPVPYRGKRCESAFIVETAKALADVKEISLEEVSAETTRNAMRIFRIP